jgi:redox-sensitive bicupin YhaK (pirin superfamily)
MSRTTDRRATITIRPASERGHFDHGWLDTYHTFSFADYHDPEHMGFRSLRVINDDRVAGGTGFGMHPHRDMEILTIILEGALEHRDSMGTGSVIRPGEVQRMTAGTGVFHSEKNPSKKEPVHLLQIWILPEERGLAPGYEQKNFPIEERRGVFTLVASRDGRSGSLTIHQDASVFATLLRPGDEVGHELAPGRHAWIHVARGRVSLDGRDLGPGDGASISDAERFSLRGVEEAEVIVFDLA